MATVNILERSESVLIAIEHAKQNLRVSVVYVLNMRGQPLMPTTPRKAKRTKVHASAKAKELLHILKNVVSTPAPHVGL
jgi:hypothetical protein